MDQFLKNEPSESPACAYLNFLSFNFRSGVLCAFVNFDQFSYFKSACYTREYIDKINYITFKKKVSSKESSIYQVRTHITIFANSLICNRKTFVQIHIYT